MTKYLVTGATGQLGQLVLDSLHKANIPAADTAVLLRRKETAEAFKAKGYDVRIGDYSDANGLRAAFAGVDRMLMISGSEVGQRVMQHQNVIAAAKAAGVSYMAYTSFIKAADSPNGLAPEHKATEGFLAASGLDYTVLRNGWYTENFLMALPQILEMGQHFGAAGDAKWSPATRADLALAAANVLTGKGHEGKTYELAGDQDITYGDFVAQLSELSGKEVTYVDMPQEAFQGALENAGLPAVFAQILAGVDVSAKDGWLHDESKALSGLIGRPTTDLKSVLTGALTT